jgi:hypothetical protein
MISAWLYNLYGKYPIAPNEIQDYVTRLGITVSSRIDNTLRQATRDGKTLFRQVGKGWEPTLAGEKYFKDNYKVKKGNKSGPAEEG